MCPASIAERFRKETTQGTAESVARFAEDHLWELFNTAYSELRQAISSLPVEVMDQHPVLQILHPMTPSAVRSTHHLETSQFARYLESKSVDPHLIAVMQIIAFRLNGEIQIAYRHALRLKTYLSQSPLRLDPSRPSPLWFYHHQIGATMLMAGNTTAAISEFAAARQLGQSINSTDAIRCASEREALIHAARGSLEEALRSLELADSIDSVSDAFREASNSTSDCAKALLALLAYENNIEDKLQKLKPLDAVDVAWPFILLARTNYELARQQPHAALEAVSIAMAAHYLDPYSLAYDIANAKRIEAYTLLGNTDQATHLAETCTHAGVYTKMAVIRLAICTSRFNRAAQLAYPLATDESLSPHHRAELTLLKTWAEFIRLGKVTTDSAYLVATCIQRNNRQLLCGFPRSYYDEALSQIPESEQLRCRKLLEGLSFRRPLQRKPELTKAELRVLEQLAHGTKQAEIAKELGLSLNTVKTQLRLLYRKLDASSRQEALIVAHRHGFLHPAAGVDIPEPDVAEEDGI